MSDSWFRDYSDWAVMAPKSLKHVIICYSSFNNEKIMTKNVVTDDQGHTQGGGAVGLHSSQTPQNRNLKDTYFVDIVISKVIRDLPFSRNQPLKLADD
jgi:hypothetical protein